MDIATNPEMDESSEGSVGWYPSNVRIFGLAVKESGNYKPFTPMGIRLQWTIYPAIL